MGATAAGVAGAAIAGKAEASDGYDLVMQNVRALIGGEFKPCDLGIRGNKIAAIAEPKSLPDATTVIWEQNLFVSPGWVDLHCHLVDWRHGKSAGSPIRRLGLDLGVTALLDAGTVGAANFEKFEKTIAADPEVPCFSLINICREGIKLSDYFRTKPGWEDLPAMAALYGRAKDKIKGIKYRADWTVTPRDDRLYYVRKCREAGDLLKLPVMIHIGGAPPTVADILPLLKEGDIITHFLRGQGNCIINPNGKVSDEVKEACARGVKFDLGHGMGSFAFAAAERALDQGFTDFTISSDLYIMSTRLYAKTFANVLTQFLALGFPLPEIIERACTRPARFLGLEREIKIGADATLTAFRVVDGDFSCMDVTRKTRKSKQRIFPAWTVMSGKSFHVGRTDEKLFL